MIRLIVPAETLLAELVATLAARGLRVIGRGGRLYAVAT